MQFTKEQMEKAMACKSSDELLALAEAEGVAMTREAAEKYYQQLSGASLSMADIESVAGGCFTNVCVGDACANLC